jgi:hypothetical protein
LTDPFPELGCAGRTELAAGWKADVPGILDGGWGSERRSDGHWFNCPLYRKGIGRYLHLFATFGANPALARQLRLDV